MLTGWWRIAFEAGWVVVALVLFAAASVLAVAPWQPVYPTAAKPDGSVTWADVRRSDAEIDSPDAP